MQLKIFVPVLFGVFLSANSAHAQARAIAGFFESLGLFGRSARVETRGLASGVERLSKPQFLTKAERDLIFGSPDAQALRSIRELEPLRTDFLDRHAFGLSPEARMRLMLDRYSILDPIDEARMQLLMDSYDLGVAREPRDFLADSEKSASDAAKPDASQNFKFSLLDGKLKIGKLKKIGPVDVEGGEINLYKWGAVGVAAAACATVPCLTAARRAIVDDTLKSKEFKEMLEGVEKAKRPAEQQPTAERTVLGTVKQEKTERAISGVVEEQERAERAISGVSE
jgi:hypothetical protein